LPDQKCLKNIVIKTEGNPFNTGTRLTGREQIRAGGIPFLAF